MGVSQNDRADKFKLHYKLANLLPMLSGYHKLRGKIHNFQYLKTQAVIVSKTEMTKRKEETKLEWI